MAEEGVVENDIDEDAIDDSGAQQTDWHASRRGLLLYRGTSCAPYQTLSVRLWESS
jgi:hypothetical protein